MKLRLIPLGLAACLALSITACGGGAPAESVPPSESPAVTETVADVTPAPSDSAAPEATVPSDSAVPTSEAPTPAPDTPSETPSEAPIPDKGTPPPSDAPSQAATPSEQPSGTPAASPSPTPEASETPAPDTSEEPTSTTAAQLYNMWITTSSQTPGPGANLTDMSAYVDAYYNLAVDDLEDYVLYIPDMSASLEEVFIAKAKSGKVDTVKAACQSRLDGLKEDAEFYPDTGAYLDSARLETSGDWVVLVVSSEPDRLVKILQDAVK